MTVERWAIDTAHSSVDFVVRHMVVSKTRGTFTDWSGMIEVDRANPSASSVTASIAIASVDTRDKKRDDHLRSAEFFDAAMFPTITFQSRRVTIKGENLEVVGELTMHGQTRQVTLEVEYNGLNQDPWGNARVHYSAKTSFSRKDFDIGWNKALEAGGVLVGDTVSVEIEVEALRATVTTP